VGLIEKARSDAEGPRWLLAHEDRAVLLREHFEPSASPARRQLVVRRNAISKYVDTPKSGHGRVIDLSSELTTALERHRKVIASTTGRVMLQDSGKPAVARHLYQGIRQAMAKAGIPRRKGVALHVMRHSACSELAAMGAPTIAIQALARHESPQTTQKYMHLAPGLQAAAVALFDRTGHGTGVARGGPGGEKC
jgi:integrase